MTAALDLSARMGWDMVTLTDIADGAACSLAELSEVFEDKADILGVYGRQVDRKVLEACADPDPSMPERERLFEILMERFDVLSGDRAALVSIVQSFVRDPKQAVIGVPHLGRSMAWMLEAAGIETNGLRGAVRVMGLSGVYLYVLKVWMADESEDLARTMAALDRALDRAEKCAGTFRL